jgi:hypothetical protein
MARSDRRLRKIPKLISREVDGEFFVIDDVAGRIHSLGQAGSAVWRLLDQPQSREDCVEVFSDAFPEHGRAKLEELVDGVIAQLDEAGLVY